MSKERLEEINNFSSLPLKKRISLTKKSIKKELKANDYHMPKNININTQYLLEIIEQAERVDILLEQTGHNFEVNRKLDAQNKRYREAINEFFDLDGDYKDIVNRAERMFIKVLDEIGG